MLRQFSWVTFGRVFAALVQMATLTVLANWVSPGEFGLIVSITAMATIPQTLFDFGIATFVVRHRAMDRNDGLVTFALRVNDYSSLCLGVLFALMMLILGLNFDSLFLFLIPLGIWIGAERNTEIWLAVTMADGEAHLNVISLVARRIVALLLMVLGWFALDNAALAYSVSLAISSLISAVVAKRWVRPRLSEMRSMGFGHLLKLTWPYWLNSSAIQLRNLDSLLVTVFAGPVQSGLYAVASRLTNPLRILPDSMATVVLPGVSRSGGSLDRKSKFVVTGMLIVMAFLYIGLSLLSPWVVSTFLGPEYLLAILPVQIVCYGLIFSAISSILSAVLQARGRAKAVSFTAVVTSVLCIPAVILGSLSLGAVGGALGLVSSFVIQFIILGIIGRGESRKIVASGA